MLDDANWNNITSIGSPHAPNREHSETFFSAKLPTEIAFMQLFMYHLFLFMLLSAFDNILKGKFINCTNNFLYEKTNTTRMLAFREKRAWMRAWSTRVASVYLLGENLTASNLHFAGVAALVYHYVLSNPFFRQFCWAKCNHVDRNTVCLPPSL